MACSGGVQFNKEQKVVAENHDSDSNALGSRLSLHLQKRQEGARRNSSMLKIGKMPPNVDRKISTSVGIIWDFDAYLLHRKHLKLKSHRVIYSCQQ